MKTKHKILIFTLAASLLGGCAQTPPKPDNPYFAPVPPAAMSAPKPVDGAIFHAGHSVSLYEDGNARRVGDILTIVLTERTQASKSSETELEKNSDVSITAPTILGSPLTINGNEASFSLPGGTRTFESTGDADQSNSLSGDITVTVSDVLPNGVLRVRGEKWMTLTSGDEYIRISGLVRPQDIKPDNTLDSVKLADARITYSGTGEVHDTNKMGWFTRFFYSPLWPF
ncbi:flagellar basal body L-ring protein FlgH [Motiliproteus coralliicola]|uniref:Flagellar L-ring protein n=1 Tax=Motiliproteus coralliicola TaxID=2283196 RepID=A0A369WL15_9GAMM|nr:flagellar basal body L-ring protein FlgH [Motiliproteus coralliicola]RDE22392.1 flagellar basal body L-ring protein FlgH [Motiliproteus coralliicola]